jgi:hypothetical protein
MNNFELTMLACAACSLLVMAIAHRQWSNLQRDTNYIYRDFLKDFQRTKDLMERCSFSDCDVLIDNFENRWGNFIQKSKFDYYRGKLIDIQYKNYIS